MSDPLSYLGQVTANTRDKARRALAFLNVEGYHPTHFWGFDPNPKNPEHYSRTAIDFMVFSNTRMGDEFAEWLWANRVALGLKHQIWKQRIRSTIVSPGVWRPMANRGSPTANHRDHVHAWFYDSPWKTQPVPPRPDQPAPGTDRIKTAAMQAALELPTDGLWGATTDAWALRMRTAARSHLGHPKNAPAAFRVDLVQKVVDTPVDNHWGPKTQAGLKKWVAALQGQVLKVKADGIWGPGTDAAFLALRKANLGKY